jgi:hypothetical protein
MGTVPIWNKGRESVAEHDSTGERLAEQAAGAARAREAAGRQPTRRRRRWRFRRRVKE